VRLARRDDPGLVLLQEVPAWALPHLGGWSGATAVGDVAQPPRLGPVPIPAAIGKALTGLRPGLLRSAFAGQGNAILLGQGLQRTGHDVLVLNPAGFRRTTAHALGLDPVARLAWAKERRVCQLVHAVLPGGTGLLVANLHATSFPVDLRVPAAEVARALEWVGAHARPGDVLVAGGDFNVDGAALELPAGWSAAGPGIDHVLVRGASASPLRVWPDGDRRRQGMLLSDHAPVELEIGIG
jgi:endonuclease/exonuclease/phosphatase family metal-dependent hydrolase